MYMIIPEITVDIELNIHTYIEIEWHRVKIFLQSWISFKRDIALESSKKVYNPSNSVISSNLKFGWSNNIYINKYEERLLRLPWNLKRWTCVLFLTSSSQANIVLCYIWFWSTDEYFIWLLLLKYGINISISHMYINHIHFLFTQGIFKDITFVKILNFFERQA